MRPSVMQLEAAPLAFTGRRAGTVQVLAHGDDGLQIRIVSQTKHKHNCTVNILKEIPADFGRGFKVKKLGQDDLDAYDVLLSEEGCHCTCWDAAGGDDCRHILAIRTLLAASVRLDGLPALDPDAEEVPWMAAGETIHADRLSL